MKFRTLIAACAAAIAAALPAHALTVKHAQGETEVKEKPAKVLVFDIASLDNLDALGVEANGVPAFKMPSYLSKYDDASVPKIGTLFEPDFEAVAAAEPDLIIVGGRSSAKYAELAKLAPTIDLTVDRKAYVEGVKNNLNTLGQIFGKQAEAKARTEALDASIAKLHEASAKAGTVLVVLTTGGRMSVHGPGSRFGVVYDEYGFKPAVENTDTGTHGQAVSNEFIAKTNPDWLFVVDRDAAIGQEGQAAKQLLDNELVRQTTAWQKNHLVYLDAVNWYLVGGGYTGMLQGVEQLTKAVSAQ